MEKLIYLTKEEFKFFKGLKEEFCKQAAKIFKKPQDGKKECPKKPVEGRSLTRRDKARSTNGFIYGRELIAKNWHRVTEYYQEITASERYEKILKEIKM